MVKFLIDDSVDKSKFKRTSKRILVKSEGLSKDDLIKGRIISIAGKNFIVKSADANFPSEIECVSSGTFYTKHGNSTLLTVGDFVGFSIDIKSKNKILGSIHSVHNRSTWMSRRPVIGTKEDVIAANVEYTAIISSCEEPRYNTRLIDRLIIASEIGNLKPIVIVNKTDLANSDNVIKDMKVYKSLGYPVFMISVIKSTGLEKVRDFLQGKETIFIGTSGVGKSSLINFLMNKNIQKIENISSKTKKGKHTTSHACLFDIDSHTRIIDTPGIREFGIVNIKKEELTLYFHDFRDYYEHCKFMPCTHTHEPGCEIKLAVDNGKISVERYQSYLNIFDSI